MITATTVFTYEIDDPAKAAKEISCQLAEKFISRKHTAGIILCDPEFIASGSLKAICDTLPFPTVGVTTMSQAVKGESGIFILTMMVLTSDDISFAAGMTESLNDDIYGPTKQAIESSTRSTGGKSPSLAIVFPPLIDKHSGDSYVDILQRLIGKTPVFGSVAIDEGIDYANTASIFDGRAEHDAMSFLLLFGPVNPRFLIATISSRTKLPHNGRITKASDNIVHEINGIRAIDFFEQFGLVKNGVLDQGLRFVPFRVETQARNDYDGVPVIRGIADFDEHGNAVCRGKMWEGSDFAFGLCDKDDILDTTSEVVSKVNMISDANAVLMFSCMIRRMVFGVEPFLEQNRVLDRIKSDTPFMMGYSGGEICPTSIHEGEAVNRFHNYSFIVCVL